MDRQTKRLPILDKQKKIVIMTDGIDNCMNTTVALRIKGKLDFCRLEKAIQKVIDENDALRFVFHVEENGEVYQQVLDKYQYTLDVRNAEGSTAEEKERSVLLQARAIMDGHQKFDGGVMHQFVLFDLQEQDYILFACINHIITDGVSNTIAMYSIIAAYNGLETPHTGASYLDFIVEENRFIESEEGKAQIEYWQEESRGYSEDFIKFPVENRKKSALKLFFMTELKPIREFARANKISVSTVNVFLCHAAISGAFGGGDTAVRIGDANRTKVYRQTMGFFATVALHRLTFTPQMTLREAFAISNNKYAENMKNARLGNFATPTLFTFSYLNYNQGNAKMPMGEAVAEPYIGIHESKIWDSVVLVVAETEENLIYKIGCDEDAFPPQILEKMHRSFALAVQCLTEQDMTFEEFWKALA